MSTLSITMAKAMKENVAVDIGHGTIGGAVNTLGRNSAIVNTLSKPFNKITVNNVLNDSNAMNCLGNSQNTIIRKINDFGMFGAVKNAAANKRPTTTTTLGRSLLNKIPICKTKLNAETKQQEKGKPTTQAIVVAPIKKARIVKDPETAAAAKIVKTKQNKLSRGDNNVSQNTSILDEHNNTVLKSVGTPGRKGMPLPQAVARRNARERNRVKQVNNGFAALRQHIPEDVSEAFESQGNSSRGTSKKLSKVETLRMAVEYIRSLERLLGYEFPETGLSVTPSLCSSSSGEDSFMAIKDEYDTLEDNFDDSMNNYDHDECTNYNSGDLISAVEETKSSEIDKLSNLTTLNGLQYMRIPGTNTYQLMTSKVFSYTTNRGSASNSSIDDEQLNALIDTNYPIAGVTATMATADLNIETTRTQEQDIVVESGETRLSDSNVLTEPNTITTAKTTTSIVVSAPAMPENKLDDYKTNDNECVKFAFNSAATTTTSKSLSRSTLEARTSPTGSSSLHHQHQQQQQLESRHFEPPLLTITTMNKTTTRLPHMPSVSPAITNELLLQTCATTGAVIATADRQFVVSATTTDPSTPQQQQQQQQHQQQQQQQQQHMQLIKQEFVDEDFANASNTIESIATTSLLRNHICYAPIQQQQLLSHAALTISPLSLAPPAPYNNNNNNSNSNSNGNSTPMISTNMESSSLQNFYEHETNSFYEGGAVTLKKEFENILALDTSATTAGLSDESMIDAIDWWEAHTPKSNGDSPIL